MRAHVGTWVASCCVKFIQLTNSFFLVSSYLLSVPTRPPKQRSWSLALSWAVLQVPRLTTRNGRLPMTLSQFDLICFDSVNVSSLEIVYIQYWWPNKWEAYLRYWFLIDGYEREVSSRDCLRLVKVLCLQTNLKMNPTGKLFLRYVWYHLCWDIPIHFKKCWYKDSQYSTSLCYSMPINTGQRKFSSTMSYHNHVLKFVS